MTPDSVRKNGKFPVKILRSTIRYDIVDKLLEVTNRLLRDPSGKWDYSHALAGKISRGAQLKIPSSSHEVLDGWDIAPVAELFLAFGRQYLRTCTPDPNVQKFWDRTEIEIDDIWCISQLAGDYNPLHGHDGLLSAVLYLQVPDRIAAEEQGGGWLTFRHSDPFTEILPMSNLRGHELDFVYQLPSTTVPHSSGSFTIKPIVGECWMFPSWLLHEVTAFQGSGERRSIAFNIRQKQSLMGSPRHYENSARILKPHCVEFFLFP